MTGKTRTAAIAVGHELSTLLGIPGDRAADLTRLCRRRRRCNVTERVVLGLVACGPTAIALPRPRRRITLGFERGFVLDLRLRARSPGNGKGGNHEQDSGRAARQNPATRHRVLP